jgi:hypothetical protein
MSTERTNQNEVANRAYRFWENAGRPRGRDLEFWVQAEVEAHGPVTGDTTGLGDTSDEGPLQAAQSSPSVAIRSREFQHRTSPAAQSAARKGTSRAR